MPMRRVGEDWQASESGWGLIDAHTGQPVVLPDLITDANIEMTDWELQDFAVQVVQHELQERGRQLLSWSNDPRVLPSLWFVGDAGPEWVMVQSVRYPSVDIPPPSTYTDIRTQLRASGYPGNSAVVMVARAEDPFDPDAQNNGNFLPLYRGYGMHIRYAGVQRLNAPI